MTDDRVSQPISEPSQSTDSYGRTDGLTETSSPTSDRSSFTFVPRTKQNPIRPAELMRQAVAAGLAASRHRDASTESPAERDEKLAQAKAEIEAARKAAVGEPT